MDSFFSVNPDSFEIKPNGGFTCAILRNAIQRYSRLIAEMGSSGVKDRQNDGLENSVHYLVSEWNTKEFPEHGNIIVTRCDLVK